MEDIINNYYQQGGIAMMVQDLAKNKIEPSKFWQYFRQDYTAIDNVHTMMTNKDLQNILTYYYDDIGYTMDTREYEIYEELNTEEHTEEETTQLLYVVEVLTLTAHILLEVISKDCKVFLVLEEQSMKTD